jgi:hypothetical protein
MLLDDFNSQAGDREIANACRDALFIQPRESGEGGIGGLWPPFSKSRTPMQSIGYGVSAVEGASAAKLWDQYVPMQAQEDEQYIFEFLYVRVSDLNADDDRRDALMRENPPWLDKEGDKERFLRARVVLNIYEKFKVRVLVPTAAIAWNVTRDEEHEA